MRPKPYSPEKRILLAEKPQEVRDFMQQLPLSQQRNIALKLPPIPKGFRRGTVRELQQRLIQFAFKIRHWTDGHWVIFQEIWLLWIQRHPELAAIVDSFDNQADFDGETPTPANSPLDISCLDRLVQLSREWKISQEIIVDFYTFGYFAPDEQIEQEIRLARSEGELQIPRDLASLKNQVEELMKAAKSTAVQVETWQKDRVKLDSLNRIQGQVNEAFRSLQELETDVKATASHFEAFRARMEDEARTIRIEAERQFGEVRSDLAAQTAAIRQDLEQVIRTVAEFDERLTSATAVSAAKSLLRQLEDAEIGVSRNVRGDGEVWPTFHQVLTPERLPSYNSDRSLESPAAVTTALSDSFRSIGMQSQAAQAVAVEVLAAALAGQTVLFRGSLAKVVAEVCARTLGDGAAFRLQIPVGLLDGQQFGTVLENLLEEVIQSERTAVLLLNGVNLSAPEVYASRLHRLVSERLLGLDRNSTNLLILGTVADGAAALPLSPLFCEMGPILDLDCVSWRNRWPQREIVCAWISRKIWKLWIESDGEAPIDWDDHWREIMHLTGPVTALWRRSVYAAYTRLSNLGGNDSLPSVLQSLAYGWLLPRIIASGADPGEKRGLLPPEILDGDRPDKRIALLLNDRGEGEE